MQENRQRPAGKPAKQAKSGLAGRKDQLTTSGYFFSHVII